MAKIQVQNPHTGRTFTINAAEFDSIYAPLGWTKVGVETPITPTKPTTIPATTPTQEPTQNYLYGNEFLDRKANDAAVNALYQAYFGRDATRAELNNWGSAGGPDTTVKALEDFLQSERQKYGVTSPVGNLGEKQDAPFPGGQTETPVDSFENDPRYQEALAYINGLDMGEEMKVILRAMIRNQMTSGTEFYKPEDIDSILSDIKVEVEKDFGDYYQRIEREDIEDFKNRIEDLRGQALRYQEQSGEQYNRQVDQKRKNLRARGLTFSGAQRIYLGKEGAIDSAGREGQIPQDRRFAYENVQAGLESQLRDTGLGLERRIGSERMGALTGDLGSIPDPYGQGRDYQASLQRPIYTPTGGVDYGQYDRDKTRDIAKEKQRRLSQLAQYN